MERLTRLERAYPGWKPGALPSELQPHGVTNGDRTRDLNLGKVALCHLSYSHIGGTGGNRNLVTSFAEKPIRLVPRPGCPGRFRTRNY